MNMGLNGNPNNKYRTSDQEGINFDYSQGGFINAKAKYQRNKSYTNFIRNLETYQYSFGNIIRNKVFF